MAEPRSGYPSDMTCFLHLPSSHPVCCSRVPGLGPGRQVAAGPVVGLYIVKCCPGGCSHGAPMKATGRGCSRACRGLSSSTHGLFILQTSCPHRAMGTEAEF